MRHLRSKEESTTLAAYRAMELRYLSGDKTITCAKLREQRKSILPIAIQDARRYLFEATYITKQRKGNNERYAKRQEVASIRRSIKARGKQPNHH